MEYKSGGTLPSQEPIHKPLPNSALCVKTSTYENNFPDKSGEVKIIDYRELDCAKNKLKYIMYYEEISIYLLQRIVRSKK